MKPSVTKRFEFSMILHEQAGTKWETLQDDDNKVTLIEPQFPGASWPIRRKTEA